jgi:hypothetical protein
MPLFEPFSPDEDSLPVPVPLPPSSDFPLAAESEAVAPVDLPPSSVSSP